MSFGHARVPPAEPLYGTAEARPTAFASQMPPTGEGSSAPEGGRAVGVGQMKLDAPPRYAGGRKPGVRVWLSHMERYMRLMRYDQTDWLDIVAMRVNGSASAGVNAALQGIQLGRRARF